MTSLEYHYKDREPKETIQIITDFFKSKGLEIKILKECHSEIDTYSCRVGLYLNTEQILTTNGKGETQIYSYASGLAELYERFCLYYYFCDNPITIKKIEEKRYEKYGYYLHPLEKLMSINEIIQDSYSEGFKFILPQKNFKKNIKLFFKIFQNNKILGFPYYDLNNNLFSYKNFYTIISYEGTNGLAAGNTLEEALVQGASELFERQGIKLFFKNQNSITYYYLDLNLIHNNQIQNKIKKIQQQEYQIFLYDLSYNFNIPVICLFIINNLTHNFYLKFGSHPVFDIAVERCFTELYQGINFLPNYPNQIIAYNDSYYDEAYSSFYTHTTGMIFNDKIFLPYNLLLNSKIKSTYNKDYFLNNNNYTNKNLIDFIQKINKINNYQMIWTNLSLSKKFFSIHIIFSKILIPSRPIQPKEQKVLEKYFLIFKNFYYYFLSINNNNNNNKNHNMKKIIQLLEQNTEPILNISMLFNILTQPISCQFTKNNINYENILKLFYQDFNTISFPINNIFHQKFQQYLLYYNLILQKCSLDQIAIIFNRLNYNDLLSIKNITNSFELIDFIFFDSINFLYNSLIYKKFINILI